MPSDREKRIIEVRGELELLKEEAAELLLADRDLDEFEKEWLRSIIDNIKILEAELEALIKGE